MCSHGEGSGGIIHSTAQVLSSNASRRTRQAKSSPELHPDHRNGANRMGRAPTQCRSQYPRPSTCCATWSSGEVKWRHILNRSNISIKDKQFRVRQLLKEDAGSGVRADDSGVGVFIIFVNINNQHNCHPLHINHDHDQGDPPPLGRYQRPTRRGRLAPRLRRRSQLQR